MLGLMAGDAAPTFAQGAAACQPGATVRPDIGIQGLRCVDCALRRSPDGAAYWRFSTEPEVTSVTPVGLAAGLKAGDRIVGLDGHMITSEAARQRWAALQPGDSLRLQVRRSDDVTSIILVAGLRCSERVSSAASSPGSSIGPGTSRSLMPAGYLGLALRCECQVQVVAARARWQFSEPPQLTAVAPGGPADRAGLKAGDVIQRIDGVAIDVPAGGDQFSRIAPGDTVALQVGRGTGELTLRLVAVVPPSRSQ